MSRVRKAPKNAIRERMVEAEEQGLSVLASRSRFATRRQEMDDDGDYRTAYLRDRDRIIHSRAFRRLKHKTQVFIPFEGDHFRTRLTHTLEVSQIARTAARALRLNEDLAEAIALGHDLGHTPFGHSGEKVLNWILTGVDERIVLPEAVSRAVGGFKHNYQSVRIVDSLEYVYDSPGLNLTDQTREGLLKHTSWKRDYPFPLPDAEGLRLGSACHLEGQLVAWADEIAQQAHDLEDGIHEVAPARLAELEIARRTGALEGEHGDTLSSLARSRLVRGIISILASDLIDASYERMETWIDKLALATPEQAQSRRDRIPGSVVSFSKAGEKLYLDLKEFVYRYIIQSFTIARNDGRARTVVRGLFAAYHENPRLAPDYLLRRYAEAENVSYLREITLKNVEAEIRKNYRDRPAYLRLVADHIAGMTDSYALDEFGALTGAFPSGARGRST